MAIHGFDESQNRVDEYMTTVRRFRNTTIVYHAFSFGNVRRLDINGKFIYLWQSVKGDVHYCFSLFEKEYYTTSATKLGNVLTEHFDYEVEVVNNNKDQLKKLINATTGLNKALADYDRQSYYASYQQQEVIQKSANNISSDSSSEQLVELLDGNTVNNNANIQPYQQVGSVQQNTLYNQENLLNGVIQLSTYSLESHIGTYYIKINELPVIHKEKYLPIIKQAFFQDESGLRFRNKFIPTPWMVYHFSLCNPKQSFIILFIFYMAKKNIHNALKILAWISDSYKLQKLPFALVLHSSSDVYMKILYEDILEPLFHDFQCEKVTNDDTAPKSLSENLDEKIIYNFHNITTQTIQDEFSYELINRLIHKHRYRLNRKNITTIGNILVTSTSKYIPMISKIVPTATAEIDSSIDALCEHLNIRPNKNVLANMISNDFGNFVGIIRNIDTQMLNKTYSVIDQDDSLDILDGDDDVTEVFDSIIRDKNITPFKVSGKTKKQQKLVDEMGNNFNQDRVDKAHLLNYFEILFGKNIHKSNTALIKVLREDYSKTGEPFDDYKTHVRKGRAYYFI